MMLDMVRSVICHIHDRKTVIYEEKGVGVYISRDPVISLSARAPPSLLG